MLSILNCSHTLYQEYLDLIYPNLAHSHIKSNHLFETQGEILFHSMNELLSKLALTEQDRFIDFGSGNGKVAIQVFMTSIVQAVYGIEILPELHQRAETAAKKVREELGILYKNKRILQFLQGDFFKIQLPIATVAWINSTCFTQNMLYRLGNLINHLSSIHTVLTTRPIINLVRLPFKKIIHIECSWDSALCYVYSSSSG